MARHALWVLLFFATSVGPTVSQTLPFPEGLLRTIGGGEDYAQWVTASDHQVSSLNGLRSALAAVALGKSRVIYIHDDAELLVPQGAEPLRLPAGVTLASGRGRGGSLGALIKVSDGARQQPLIEVLGPNVRITGLRIFGPYTEIPQNACNPDTGCRLIAISISGRPGEERAVLIDNNELSAWPMAAIDVNNVRTVNVRHNHIHHNRQDGRGYGVVVDNGGVLVEHNLFHHNRHNVASTGATATDYTVRRNLILEGANASSFDTHGRCEITHTPSCRDCSGGPPPQCLLPVFKCPDSCPRDNKGPWINEASRRILIEANLVLQNEKPAFRARGVPTEGALLRGNMFRGSRETVDQEDIPPGGKGTCSGGAANCLAIDNEFGVDPGPAWFVSHRGTSSWRFRRFADSAVTQVRLADFDGDGRTDAFRRNGTQWELSRSAKEAWRRIGSSDVPIGELAFCDFDGDRHADVFRRTSRNTWEVSFGRDVGVDSGGMTAWREVGASNAAFQDLVFGDFDGDRHTDVFRKTPGDTWEVSFGKDVTATAGRMTGWREIGRSGVPVRELAFGDFDGDGRTDILRRTPQNTWEISFARDVTAGSGRMSAWRQVASSSVGVREVAIGDFDADGHADVLRHTPRDTWEVSLSAGVTAAQGQMTPWRIINSSNFRVRQLAFGDVDGDKRTDILVHRHPW
jgi:parallel beta helix pectate lyase-like protein/VCBS repeat protein